MTNKLIKEVSLKSTEDSDSKAEFRFSKLQFYWFFIPGLILFFLADIILIFNLNLDWFLAINRLSEFTGEYLWMVVTFISDGLVSFIILIPLLRKKPEIIWMVLIAAFFSTLLNQIIKRTMHIPRSPSVLANDQFNLIGPDWGRFSFPSGHASIVFVISGAIALSKVKWNIKVLVLLFFSLVALSRTVVGVHWPLDVVVGALMGWSCSFNRFFPVQANPLGVRLLRSINMGSVAINLYYNIIYNRLFWI
ncbi:MAG: phosphatase PAP2 family protein [bacterium]